jgi:hypothetical protein
MNAIRSATCSLGLLAMLLAPGLTRAQAPPAVVPFGPGEEARYQVKLGILNAGEGRLAVTGIDTVRGQASYALEMDLSASTAFGTLRVENNLLSWMDTRSLATRRYIRDIKEPFYSALRTYEIYPEERRWHRTDNDERGPTRNPLPLDDLAFVYYVRTLPLIVGETYTLNRYFKEDGNPVVVRVLRKETREVPAGTFNTIVVQPTIQTSGLFSQGGNAEIHFSDDQYRHVVYLRSEIPLVGSITLHLTELRNGTRLGG